MIFKKNKSKEKPDKSADDGDTLVTQITGLEEKVNNRAKDLEETEEQLRQLTNNVTASDEDEDIPAQPHKPMDELSVPPEDEQLDEEENISPSVSEADDEGGIKLVEVGAADLAKAGSAKADPAKAGSAEADPAKAGSAKADPAKAGSAEADPAKAGSAEADPAKAGSAEADPAKASSAEADPAKASVAEADPVKADSDSLDNLFNSEDDEVNPLAALINALPDVTTKELLDDLQEVQEIIREWEQR